ncbi:hypothetical protein [Kocuria sp. TGY1127_2]|nr:hypothetical protein [Kocuria sp. TGY1127_2]
MENSWTILGREEQSGAMDEERGDCSATALGMSAADAQLDQEKSP